MRAGIGLKRAFVVRFCQRLKLSSHQAADDRPKQSANLDNDCQRSQPEQKSEGVPGHIISGSSDHSSFWD